MVKVLVIDDSLHVRKTVAGLLGPRGIAVSSCASGYEAVARLPAEAPDLVICDLVLPDVDGFQICRWLRQVPKLAATPVLFVAAIVDEQVTGEVARLGVEGVLRKPFADQDLVERVERILAIRRVAASATHHSNSPAAGEGETTPAPDATAATAGSETAAPEEFGNDTLPDGSSRSRELLLELANLPGFACAVLLSPAGRVLATAGKLSKDEAAAAGAPLDGLLAAAGTLAAHFDLGAMGCAVLETADGCLLARPIDERGTVLLALTGTASMGKARLQLGRLHAALRKVLDAASAATAGDA
jgi:twitching motility two-component system response regulator PilH